MNIAPLFGLRQKATVHDVRFVWSKAMPGPVFRACGTIFYPFSQDTLPENWDAKLCAVVIFRRAIISLTLRQVRTTNQPQGRGRG